MITLENKPNVAFIRPTLNLSKPSAVEPLAQLHLATILSSTNKFNVQILDEAIAPITGDEIENVDILCISADTAQYKRACEIKEIVRQTDKGLKNKRPVHLGGSHSTAFKEVLLKDDWDGVFAGEADKYIADLIGANYHGFMIGDNITADEWGKLPIPDRDLLNNNYGKSDENAVSIFTSRGCPYSCIYCFKGIRGRKITFRPLDNVFAEIDDIVRRKFRELYIYDDTPTIKPQRIKVVPFVNT